MRYAVVGVVLIAMFGDYLLLSIIVPIVPDLFPKATNLSIGFLFSSKALAQILASPFMGYLSDSLIGPQRCLAFGLLVLATSTGIWAFFTSYSVLLVARVVQGLASSLTYTGGLALVTETHSASERGAATGVAMSGVAAGVLIGPTIGGLLFGKFGQRVTFLSIAGLLVVNLIAQLLLWYMNDHNSDTDSNDLLVPLYNEDNESLTIHAITSTDAEAQNFTTKNDEVKASHMAKYFALACDPYIQILLVALAVENTMIAMLEPLVPAILKKVFGEDTETRGLMWSVTPLCYLIATPVAGYLSDRVVRCKIITAGLLMFGISLPFAAQFGPQLPLFLTSTAIAGAATAFVDTPVMPLLADVVEWRKIDGFGTVFAMSDAAKSLGFIIGPLLGEGLVDAITPKWTFVVFGVIALVCSPIPLLLRKVPVSKDAR